MLTDNGDGEEQSKTPKGKAGEIACDEEGMSTVVCMM